jgi:hypothetical protein
MFRKTILTLAATVAVAGAALAPTSASAWTGKGWGSHHGHWNHGFYGPGYGFYGVAYNSCYKRVWVETRHGPRLRRVYICD